MGCWRSTRTKTQIRPVLILVLLEDGLLEYYVSHHHHVVSSLNPCFAGRWVAGFSRLFIKQDSLVLILVLLEDGLLEQIF